jgi:hypothetical protein
MTAISALNTGDDWASRLASAGRWLRRIWGALPFGRSTGRPAAAVQASAAPVVQRFPAASRAEAEPALLSTERQWARLTAVVSTAIDGAKSAVELQSKATQQLDLAQYGLATLMDELSAVMSVPGRRSPAKVLRFEQQPADAAPHALAA